jgi:hypothetical protein
VFITPGGSAVAECDGAVARLVSWAPAQGFQEHDAKPGPDREVEVKFRGAAGRAEIKVRCAGGQPVAEIDTN